MTHPTDLTPEHTRRPPDQHIYHEVAASYRYVESVLWTADAQSPIGGYAWHGWALREAFLSGCTYARGAVPHSMFAAMTYPDFRALCVELIEAAEDMTVENDGSSDRFDAVAERARTALAQPAPPAEGDVTDGELNAMWNCSGFFDEYGNHTGNIFKFARAAIAFDRSRRATAPPAEGEVGELGELVAELRGLADYFSGEGYSATWINLLSDTADLLEQRHPAPVPVPMRERPWEREGWCDERGCCWWANKYPPFRWEYVNRAAVIDGVMLPANALPLPAGEVGA